MRRYLRSAERILLFDYWMKDSELYIIILSQIEAELSERKEREGKPGEGKKASRSIERRREKKRE